MRSIPALIRIPAVKRRLLLEKYIFFGGSIGRLTDAFAIIGLTIFLNGVKRRVHFDKFGKNDCLIADFVIL